MNLEGVKPWLQEWNSSYSSRFGFLVLSNNIPIRVHLRCSAANSEGSKVASSVSGAKSMVPGGSFQKHRDGAGRVEEEGFQGANGWGTVLEGHAQSESG